MDEPPVWKIRVKDTDVEVEVLGANMAEVKKLFDEVASKYIPKSEPAAVTAI